MDQMYSMLKLFGERYIFCDDTQAIADAQFCHEDIAAAFAAIMDYADLKRQHDDD